jgi:hypothetical protein
MSYDPAARAAERKQDPSDTYDPAARSVEVNPHPHDPRTYPDAGLRAALLLGALFVVLFILAIIALWNRSPYNTSSTATAPTTGASAPAQH